MKRSLVAAALLALGACGPKAAPVASDDAAAIAAAERKAVADTDAAFRDAATAQPVEQKSASAG